MKNFFLCLLLLFGCTSSPQKNQKPTILVTISPYAYFVKTIGGSFFNVKVIVPSTTNPHVYEPTPKQIEKMTKATVWFGFGDPTEKKILPFFREKKIPYVDLSANIPLIPSPLSCNHHCNDEGDRHLWLDPILAKIQAQYIAKTLISLFPNNQQDIEKNYNELARQLDDLHQEISLQLSQLKESYILVSHPALGYYCQRYGLHQLSIEFDGKEPKPKQIAYVMNQSVQHHVQMILIQPQHNNKGALLIAKKLQIPVYQIDPYTEQCMEYMKHITRLIVENYVH